MLGTVVGAGNIPMNNAHTQPYPHKTCILVEKQMMNQTKMLEKKKWWKRKQERGINVGTERVTILDKTDREVFIERGYLRKDKKDKSEQAMHISGRTKRRNIQGKGAEEAWQWRTQCGWSKVSKTEISKRYDQRGDAELIF